MAKSTTLYVCSECSHKSAKWSGCCPACQQWNSFIEAKPMPIIMSGQSANKTNDAYFSKEHVPIDLKPLSSTLAGEKKRLVSNIKEWDAVLGGGIVPGSLIILTGDPGIGKSTLLLHVAHKLSEMHKVFYFSSEESLEQVYSRAKRIGALNEQLLFSDQAYIEGIYATCQQEKPDIVIIDSIQNCSFAQTSTFPGTIAQLREASFALMRLAKENNIAIIITCHITKEGHMAGPKTLEHMVDGVFYLQGEDKWDTRILRSVKNRFGPIHELGFFVMTEDGMQEMPLINQFLMQDVSNAPGSVLVGSLEGSRPLLLEIQALVVSTRYGVPQRVITGLDHKRVILIAAILEKYLYIKLSAHDIFVKVAGGMKVTESSSDLGIALALLSSYFQQALIEKTIALGELSLTGTVKAINHCDRYLKEALTFGVTKAVVAHNQKTQYKCKQLVNVYQLLEFFSPEQAIQEVKIHNKT